jgi:hypothetical protein
MNIVVIGATGAIGSRIVDEARAAGHKGHRDFARPRQARHACRHDGEGRKHGRRRGDGRGAEAPRCRRRLGEVERERRHQVLDAFARRA